VKDAAEESDGKVLTAGAKDADLRLDVYLTSQDASLSRSQVQKWIEQGRIEIDGVVCRRPSRRLKPGDVVSYSRPRPVPYHLLPEAIPLSVVYEDEAILVIDKPAGMVVHPAAGHGTGTLVHAVLAHCRDLSGIGGELRPGIVHRLDKETSGLLVVAKSDEAHRRLAEQFKSRLVSKAYQTLVFGDVREDAGRIEKPVGRHPSDRKKMSAVSLRGKPAVTSWRVAERYGEATLLNIRIETGRTHQIRVHLTSVGHPVVGDRTYGNPGRIRNIRDPRVRKLLQLLDRQALHASRLEFAHPLNGRPLAFCSPLPEDIKTVCEELRCLTTSNKDRSDIL
jgi:23S rRNA pseudouridine1911/1915/1917 synthase